MGCGRGGKKNVGVSVNFCQVWSCETNVFACKTSGLNFLIRSASSVTSLDWVRTTQDRELLPVTRVEAAMANVCNQMIRPFSKLLSGYE